MHHSHIDRFAQGDSPIHRLDSRAKLLAVVVYTGVLITFDRYTIAPMAPMAILPLAMIWLSGVPMWFALRRLAVLSPFVILLCVFCPLYDKGVHHVSLGPWAYSVTGGWLTAGNIAAKFSLGVLMLTGLISSTPFASLLEAMGRLRLPRVLVVQLGFLYRYIFLLMDEGMRIKRGRDFRGAGASVSARLGAASGMIGSLFIRTLDRSGRIHSAMCARGYTGTDHSLRRLEFKWADGAFLTGVVLYLAACWWLYPAFFNNSIIQ